MTARVLLAAGGTGGHVYPALAVAQALARHDARVHFVGGRRGIEGDLVPKAGFPLTRLPAAGLRGLGLAGALRFAVAFSLAFVASLLLVARLRPHVVLATGGYASAAPSMAAVVLRRALWLQEQNSVPGSTNRWLSRFAERVFAAFDAARPALARAGRVDVLPNPVRAELVAEAGREPNAGDFAAVGLEPGRPTVLVFGGSRGAATLNRAVREAWPRLRDETDWQLLVQTGHDEWEGTRAAMTTDGTGSSRVRVLPYLDDMAAAYRVADLVVARAGAMTLAELEVLGKPAILVPYPHATDDHQTHNAAALADRGAARVVADADFTGERLAGLLAGFRTDPDSLAGLRAAARAHALGRDTATELAESILARAEGKTA